VSTARVTTRLAIGFLFSASCFAQHWEIGGGSGYGWYHNGSIISPGGAATAGIRNRFIVTGAVSEDLYEHFSGEIRYVYQDGDTFLQNSTARGSVQAQSHTFTYDALFHFRERHEKIRPYVAGGAGGKYYETTGPTPLVQPLPRIAGLTTNSQWKAVFDFGGGVKFKVAEHFVIRADVRDYLTTFPNRLFSPVANAATRGIFHQITPMIGVGVSF
jgi:opacity protein-like surface antigen